MHTDFAHPSKVLRIAAFAAAVCASSPSWAGAATITLSSPALTSARAVGTTVSCGAPNRDPALAGPVASEYPAVALMQGLGGDALVRVDLANDGGLRYAGIEQSSGNRWLDRAALAAVRLARYAPETRNCRTVAGTYAISVRFRPEE